jgi:hypothetical protein
MSLAAQSLALLIEDRVERGSVARRGIVTGLRRGKRPPLIVNGDRPFAAGSHAVGHVGYDALAPAHERKGEKPETNYSDDDHDDHDDKYHAGSPPWRRDGRD